MQRSAPRPTPQPSTCGSADCAPAALGDAPDARLEADARALHRTVSELLRVFQFRDRDRICCHDVSVTQCYALGTLVERGELTLNELASELYLDKSTASRVVDALVAKGYVTRQPHPQDRRAVRLAVTPAGSELYQAIDSELLAEMQALVAGFEPPVRQAMNRLLSQFLRAAGPRFLRDGCCLPRG